MQASFELHTYDYLQKPADKGKIEKLLDRLISDMQFSPSLSFASDHKTVTLKISDILYITGRRNGAIIYSKNGEFPSGLALKDLEHMLAPPVCRCHNGYFVNLQQVSDFSHRTVTLKDGRKIPVGRAYYSEFLNDFKLYK
jgi:two-component system response regulator LytT